MKKSVPGSRWEPGPILGTILDAFLGTFWELSRVFLEPFGSLGGTFGRLLVNFRSFGDSF